MVLDPLNMDIEFQLKDLRKKISTVGGYFILVSILKHMLFNEYPTATVRKYHEEIVHCYEKLIKVTKCHIGYISLQSLMCCLYGSTYEDHLSKELRNEEKYCFHAINGLDFLIKFLRNPDIIKDLIKMSDNMSIGRDPVFDVMLPKCVQIYESSNSRKIMTEKFSSFFEALEVNARSEEYAPLLEYQGYVLAKMEKFQDSIQILYKSLTFFERKKDPKGQIRCLHALGIVHKEMGNLSEAMASFQNVFFNCNCNMFDLDEIILVDGKSADFRMIKYTLNSFYEVTMYYFKTETNYEKATPICQQYSNLAERCSELSDDYSGMWYEFMKPLKDQDKDINSAWEILSKINQDERKKNELAMKMIQMAVIEKSKDKCFKLLENAEKIQNANPNLPIQEKRDFWGVKAKRLYDFDLDDEGVECSKKYVESFKDGEFFPFDQWPNYRYNYGSMNEHYMGKNMIEETIAISEEAMKLVRPEDYDFISFILKASVRCYFLTRQYTKLIENISNFNELATKNLKSDDEDYVHIYFLNSQCSGMAYTSLKEYSKAVFELEKLQNYIEKEKIIHQTQMYLCYCWIQLNKKKKAKKALKLCHLPPEITRLPSEIIAMAIMSYLLGLKVDSLRLTNELFTFKIHGPNLGHVVIENTGAKYDVIFQGLVRGAKHLPGILDLGTFFKLVQEFHKAEAKKKTWRLFKNSVLISSHVRDAFYPIS